MNEKILNEISTKLDKLIAITVIQGKERDTQIRILASLGVSNSEISKLIGIPKGTVDRIRAGFNKRK